MKATIRRIGVTVVVMGLAMVLLLPWDAHAQGRPSGGGASSGSSGSAGSARGASGGVSISGSSGSFSAPSRIGGGSSVSAPSGGASTRSIPYLPGSSFTNDNYFRFWSFYNWLGSNFSWFELMQFGLWDTRRFYLNREPLVTPQMVHLTLATPLAASERLLTEVDALQALVEDKQAGKPVTKEQISAKTQEIRDLAKRIRSYQALSYFDLGKREDVAKGVDKLGLGAISQLREIATNMNTQLKNMYNQTATSTVSVNSLNQASFESMSKGIEKLSKVIENARS